MRPSRAAHHAARARPDGCGNQWRRSAGALAGVPLQPTWILAETCLTAGLLLLWPSPWPRICPDRSLRFSFAFFVAQTNKHGSQVLKSFYGDDECDDGERRAGDHEPHGPETNPRIHRSSPSATATLAGFPRSEPNNKPTADKPKAAKPAKLSVAASVAMPISVPEFSPATRK